MDNPRDIKRLHWILNEDNLVVLQLIGTWEHEMKGSPMPENKLESALRKDGFQWDINRMYQSILQLSVLKVIDINNEHQEAGYLINHEIFYMVLKTATEQLSGKNLTKN